MQRLLSAVPAARRRRAVLALTLMAGLFVAIGILPWTAPAPTGVRASAVAALIAGILIALIAWGLARSVRLDARHAAEARLDSVLAAAGGGCDCGHDHGAEGHDVTVVAPDCAGNGEGTECAHSCDACVLSQLR